MSSTVVNGRGRGGGVRRLVDGVLDAVLTQSSISSHPSSHVSGSAKFQGSLMGAPPLPALSSPNRRWRPCARWGRRHHRASCPVVPRGGVRPYTRASKI